jgi:cell division protein FtsI/penicillin-binding protein 2
MVRLTLISFFIIALAAGLSATANKSSLKESSFKDHLESRKNISRAISSEVKKNSYPTNAVININDDRENYKVEYTLDRKLQKQAHDLLQRYKPDYGAIFMINAETGEVLAIASQQKGNPNGENLNLKATFPAASVFKVVTATAAVDGAKVDPKHKIAFNGGNYTLYKSNVLSDKINRWTKFITLKDAFARSINTAFGRLTMENLNPAVISEYADKFMFNEDLGADFNVEQSQATIPKEKGFELTQVASGYNRKNTLSPVHGAMIASAIINDGKMVTPYIVESVKNDKNEVVYTGKSMFNNPVMSKASASKIKDMMEQTVLTGTSRKTFRQMVRDKKFKEIEMGGKTGHFSGLNPKGTTDWFVGYATDGDTKIAIATITVNVKKWTVKSSALAQMMFKKYYE